MFLFNIVDLQIFLSSYYALNKTFDVRILLLNPMRIIVISEEEYKLSVYDKTI